MNYANFMKSAYTLRPISPRANKDKYFTESLCFGSYCVNNLKIVNLEYIKSTYKN